MISKQPIATMLFDLDGTLLDTAPDFVHVLEQLCRENDQQTPSAHAIHQTVSSGARALVQLAFQKEPGDKTFAQLHQRLLELYSVQILNTQAQLYPGMAELLANLQAAEIPWGVVTNKPEPFSLVLLEKLGLNADCSVLICPEHVTFTKPHPEPLLLACQRLGKTPATTVYIGDHPRDIDSGKQAGMTTVAAAYGYLPAEPALESWGADVIVNSVAEISAWLMAHDARATVND